MIATRQLARRGHSIRGSSGRTAMRFRSQEDADEFQKEITQAALRWGRPIWWYDWQQPFEQLSISGASCFVLRSKTRCFGVTAAHVVEAIMEARSRTASLDCRIGLMPLYLPAVIIDWDRKLDIATFAISDQQVRNSGIQPFDISIHWPPPEGLVARQMPIQLVGFPEQLREIDYAGHSVACRAYGALALVEDYSDREIITIYDPKQCVGEPSLLPLGFNLSGCSGGPAVIHQTLNKIHRWYPVGMILRGPKDSEGDATMFDMIRVRRIDCIDEEGRIGHANTGWLPS